VKSALTGFAIASIVVAGCAHKAGFSPPSSERVAGLVEFAGPVNLTRHVATPEQLARPNRKGIPLASFVYSDLEHSSDTIAIRIYPAGAFLSTKRPELARWASNQATNRTEASAAWGAFRASDGRPIYQLPLGLGPGGTAYAALLACRDDRYEIVLIQSTNFHDDEDGKEYAHHVSPKKELRSIIEAIEEIVLW
jgi:hypothetical protein